MKPTRLFFAFAVALSFSTSFTGNSFAQTTAPRFDVGSVLPTSFDDPYDPKEVFSEGPNKGQLIPSTYRRSIQVVSRNRAAATVTVANVLHDNIFHLATIPLNGVEAMIFQIDYFNSEIPAAHTELRIRFKKDHPVILSPQLLSQKGQSSFAIREMVFSIEAIKSESSAMSLIKGMQKYYAVSYRFISMKDKRRDLVEIDKEKVTQYRLRMTPAEQRAFLVGAIEVSNQKGIRAIYHTWSNNCTTELIRLLDETVNIPAWRRHFKNLATIGAHYPVFVRSALRARGLLGKELPRFDLDPSVDTSETPVAFPFTRF